MRNNICLALCLLSIFYICSSQLKPTNFDMGSVIGLTTEQVIKVLTEQQSDMYEKCLKHVLREFREQLEMQGLSREQVNKRIYEKVASIHRLWIQLKAYMVDKLFHKFEMDQLSEGFQQQIKQFPDDYFLTFEMYDLLFD